MDRQAGRYIQQQGGEEPFSAYIPNPLPPIPPLEYQDLEPLLSEAALELGRLDGVGRLIAEAKLFLYAYVRKEAVLSSQIEGTQSSLSDLLQHENASSPGVPEDDVVEVSNYVAAMEHGLQRVRHDQFPLSLRLIKEIHAVLMRDGRGAHAHAGEFRRTQNWIGGQRPGNARFVPPPAHAVLPALGDLEKFLNDPPGDMHPLISAGLAHVQFETIHPFLDGNGRLGRLLITFMLCASGVLQQPLLYLSLFFKDHRAEYYDLLNGIRTDGNWERWLRYYLTGVRDVSKGAREKAQRILTLFEQDSARIATIPRSPRATRELFTLLKERGMVSITIAAQQLDVTFPTAAASLRALEDAGIVREMTGGKRGKVYSYDSYVRLLSQD